MFRLCRFGCLLNRLANETAEVAFLLIWRRSASPNPEIPNDVELMFTVFPLISIRLYTILAASQFLELQAMQTMTTQPSARRRIPAVDKPQLQPLAD